MYFGLEELLRIIRERKKAKEEEKRGEKEKFIYVIQEGEEERKLSPLEYEEWARALMYEERALELRHLHNAMEAGMI